MQGSHDYHGVIFNLINVSFLLFPHICLNSRPSCVLPRGQIPTSIQILKSKYQNNTKRTHHTVNSN